MRAPALRRALRIAFPLWLPRLSATTMSPGFSVGISSRSTQWVKAAPLIGPSRTQGAVIPSWRRPAEGHGLPVPVRRAAAQALASGSPASKRRHVCFQTGFVDEDQTAGIDPVLVAPPPVPLACHVRPGLLASQDRFF